MMKNIELPQWVIDELQKLADKSKTKLKPYIELRLEKIAEQSVKAKNQGGKK